MTIRRVPTLEPAEARALSRRWQKIWIAFARLPQVDDRRRAADTRWAGLHARRRRSLRRRGERRFGLPE